jgi:hypothetical protein
MYQKSILLSLLSLLVALPLSAQISLERQVIGSLGQLSNSSSIQLSATAGESAVITLATDEVLLLQGFQQPEPEDITSSEYLSKFLNDLSVSPNPAEGRFWVEFTTSEPISSISLEAVDLMGRMVQEQHQISLVTGRQLIPVVTQNWSTGLYLVRLRSSSGQLLGTTKVMVR